MPSPTPEQRELLAAVSTTRAESKSRKAEIRAHFRSLQKEAEREVDASVDRTVREAIDGECPIAWVKEAYDTKDYGTIKRILDRTPSLASIKAEAALNGAYSFTEDGLVRVNYHKHGPAKLTGTAVFQVVDLDGDPMFSAAEENPDDPGEVYRMIDGELEGPYYSELASWYNSHKSSLA